MAINIKEIYCQSLRLFFAALLFFGLVSFLEAQSAGYFLDTNSDTPRFFQRLAWSGGENALRYEVIIEREEGGNYRNYLREFTAALYINVSLPPGPYRFSVIPYDILDRPGEGSQWKYIEVHPALKPELYNFLFDSASADDPNLFLFILFGENLFSETEIIILRPDGEPVEPVDVVNHADGSSVWLFFDRSRLISGEYNVSARNPGGLEAYLREITIEIPEPDRKFLSTYKIKFLSIFIGANWMPLLPIYGEGFDPSFAGASLRAGVLLNSSHLDIGGELMASWFALNPVEDTALLHTAAAGLNLLAQKSMFNDAAAINFRLGVGYAFPMGTSSMYINMGAAFLLTFIRNFYIEAGIDYTHLFYGNVTGYLRPRIGIGYHFSTN